MKATDMIGVAISVTMALLFCIAPVTAVADDGGAATQGEAGDADEAEKARQKAIADVKRQMNELQNYDPAKDTRLNGLSGEKKKQKYIELLKEHEKKVAELKKNEYYKADELKTERTAFEENMGDPDADVVETIGKMTDKEFEEFLNEAGDADVEDEAEEEEDEEKKKENEKKEEEEMRDKKDFGVPDEDGGGDDQEDEDEDKEPANAEDEYNYDGEDMALYKGEGMTRKEIEEERKSLNQEGIDKALKKFSDMTEKVYNISMLVNSMNIGAEVIREIPGWEITNIELDTLVDGFDNLVDEVKNDVVDSVKSSITGSLQPVVKITPSPSPTLQLMATTYMDVTRTTMSASSLLLASDGTLLVDEEPVPAVQPAEEVEIAAPTLDDASFADFNWKYGGFKGGAAVFAGGAEGTDGPVIGNLKINNKGLSFHYESDLSSWGLDRTDAGALACLFVLDNDGNWVGGKFDWISTSREKRDFENVYGGYGGWDLSNVPKTTTAAFVIVSKDGKKRSNVITSMWER